MEYLPTSLVVEGFLLVLWDEPTIVKIAFLPTCVPAYLPNYFPADLKFVNVFPTTFPAGLSGWVNVENKAISVQQAGAGTELGKK